MCDVVIAAQGASFSDSVHFARGAVPGDGCHIIWPLLLGQNRARYFMLTGQVIGANEALGLGLVNEVVAPADLLPRARQIAEYILARPPLAVRLSRSAMTMELKRLVTSYASHGIALEALAAVDHYPAGLTGIDDPTFTTAALPPLEPRS
jgi:enoyl-CoA hydratase/carnithine racemase